MYEKKNHCNMRVVYLGDPLLKSKDRYEFTHITLTILKPIVLLTILGFIYLFIFKKFNIGIPCVFRKLTGYICPGCGMTHALAEILNGNYKSAWEYNALSITALPIICVYLLYRWIKENLQKGDGFEIWEYLLLAVLFATALAYGFIRNKY